MSKEFTGKKMAGILVAGFGVIIAVNFTMAAIASGSFSGVVVENSYVASQKFNGWLDEAEKQKALGWTAQPARDGDRLTLATANVPEYAKISAEIRRPLGEPDTRTLSFSDSANGRLVSQEELPSGRWIVRVFIVVGQDKWSSEDHIG